MRTLSKQLIVIIVTVVLVTVAALTVGTWLGVWHPDGSEPAVKIGG